MKQCPKCKMKYDDGKYCIYCENSDGTAVKLVDSKIICPQCNSEYNNGVKFCRECGFRLDGNSDSNAISDVGENTFIEDGPDFILDEPNETLVKYNGSDSIVIIPEGIKKIANGAFKGCGSVTSVQLPDTVIEIEPYAFKDCKGLENHFFEVALIDDDGVLYKYEDIGASVVVIPNSVKIIGSHVFENDSLSYIYIPDSVVEIEEYAFSTCINLKYFNIP